MPSPSPRASGRVRRLALATWLLAALASAAEPPAASAPPEVSRERILGLLDGSETPPREADWAALGPGALPELLALVRDPEVSALRRTRAVASLAVVTHPDASRQLTELLQAPGLPPPVRAAAVLSLQRRAGLAALPALAPLLQDGDAQVRSTTARALGRMGGQEARRALEERLSTEEQAEVREALQQGLSDVEP